MTKLCDYPIRQKIVEQISREMLRQILRDGGISWQATKTWKASNDREFTAKMTRILTLHAPYARTDAGPVPTSSANRIPFPARAKPGIPLKQPARPTHTQGVRHMFASLDPTQQNHIPHPGMLTVAEVSGLLQDPAPPLTGPATVRRSARRRR
ncbi:hypothetical protein [Saccharopolyspora hattusasensis]|uniref:hypothetical protein n=1 Tax=Saccharopolyspora hattusasensis TaxID=1128679 RepID=UPI003D964A0C